MIGKTTTIIMAVLAALILVVGVAGYLAGQQNSASENSRLTQKVNQLTDSVDQLQEELSQVQAQSQQLTQELADAETQKQELSQEIDAVEQELNQVLESFFASDRTDTYDHVNSTVTRLQASPGDGVREGEIQVFALDIISESPVISITATIETNIGPLTIELRLGNGTATNGRWLGYWSVQNIVGQKIGDMNEFLVNFRITTEAGAYTTGYGCVYARD